MSAITSRDQQKQFQIYLYLDVPKKVDKGGIVALMLAAFDAVDHELLLQTLHHMYGVGKKALHFVWSESYVPRRCFMVTINGDRYDKPGDHMPPAQSRKRVFSIYCRWC